jgi:Transposase DNA-binding/Transposase Tn5 dimerisation domain
LLMPSMVNAKQNETRQWAHEEFGHAQLGDARRTLRLVRIAAEAARHPGGTVLDVFRSHAARQGAFDFLANPHIRANEIVDAMAMATASRCERQPFVFVVVDGTSLRLTDRKYAKDFGAVGTTTQGARGIKVIHAYAVSSDGVPFGIVEQQWWNRVPQKKRSDCHRRVVADKETRHWLRTIESSHDRLNASKTRLWFQIDREGDRYATLKTLHSTGEWFTVRSTYGSRFVRNGRRKERLAEVLARTPPRGTYRLFVRSRDNRKGRMATLRIHTTSVVLDMFERATRERYLLPVNIVEVHEMGTIPDGEEPIHWRLLTNHSIDTDEDVALVLYGYTQRWRIEDLHRTWKSGACRVEDTQLRSTQRVVKWAMIMVATAARIERIKHLARTDPSQPASVEFTPHEIAATLLMKRKYKRRTEVVPESMPTIAQFTTWLAELGGYTGKSSGGPPGAVTIKRGLNFILPIAAALAAIEEEQKMR